MLVMTGMLCIINEARISVPFDNNFFLFAAMMLSVDVYAIHAIENGAFFSVAFYCLLGFSSTFKSQALIANFH